MIRLKIREVAAKKHLSQSKIARMTDMDIETVRRAFRNKNITIDSLNKIANALQTHPCELFEYEPDPPPAL